MNQSGGNMNDNNGFIILKRKLLKWEWYDDTNTLKVFIHLLLTANWEDKNWQGIDVKRGQVVTSINNLSMQTNMSVQQVRTALKKLISTNEITKTSTSKYTVITINNYNKYQESNKQDNKQNNNETTIKATNNTTIKATTTKQYKQTNKNNNIIIINIYDFVEQNFGRTLSPVEYEEISTWKDTELTRYAIKQAVLSNKCGTKYISRILNAYERESIRTVQQAQERERQYIVSKNGNKKAPYEKPIPDWFGKTIEKKSSNEVEKKEMEDLLKEFQQC